jgi:hypothetical protein
MNSAQRAMAPIVLLFSLLASCSSFPAKDSWSSKGESLGRGLVLELGPESGGEAAFALSGSELEGAKALGEARRSGALWLLDLKSLEWFDNWAAGWTEGSFAMEGRLELRPEGSSWTIAVLEAPIVENATSASIRLDGEYWEGEKALSLLAHRWERIQAASAVLKERLSEPWAEKGRAAKRFLFPELIRGTSALPAGGAIVRAESIGWNTDYTRANFPESLWAVRDSGTMLRDFEEGGGLWRLACGWDDLWGRKLVAAVFYKEQ